MQHQEAKHLFQIQAELVDTKVELAVNKAIQQVVTQIIDLKQEMHKEMGGLRQEVHQEMGKLRNEVHELGNRLSSVETALGNRLSSVETALGMRNQVRSELRARLLDYVFKAGWLVLGSALMYVTIYSHAIFQ